MNKRRKLKPSGVLILFAAAVLIVVLAAVFLHACVFSRPRENTGPAETFAAVIPSEQPASPEPVPEVSEEPLPPYTIEESPITLENKYIFGKTYLPSDGKQTHPLVILCHGIGVNHFHVEHFARMFAEHGIAAYAFDFCGGGEATASSGSFSDMTVHTEEEDLKDVIEYVKGLGIAEENRLYLLGMSQGGYVVTETAADMGSEIAGLILMFPAFNINDLICANFSSPEEVPESVTIFDQTVGRQYFVDAMSEPIIEDMEQYTGPVLLLHGSEDDVVPPSYSEEAAQHFPGAEFHLIEGAGHGFFLQDAETAFSFCMDFLEAQTGEKG